MLSLHRFLIAKLCKDEEFRCPSGKCIQMLMCVMVKMTVERWKMKSIVHIVSGITDRNLDDDHTNNLEVLYLKDLCNNNQKMILV